MTTGWPGAQGAVERRHGDQEAVLLGQGLTAHPHLTILIIRCAVCGVRCAASRARVTCYKLHVSGEDSGAGDQGTLIAGLLTS